MLASVHYPLQSGRHSAPLRKAAQWFSVVWVLLFAWAAQPFAQNPTDSLIGKTIHVYVEDENFNRFWFDNASETAGLLTSTTKFEHSITISSANLSNRLQQDFFLRSDGSTNSGSYGFKLGPMGLSKTEVKFPISVFQGRNEIWIIIDPSKPLMDTPPVILFEPPKRVSVLNPWTTTGPKMISGTRQRTMSIAPNRCGWFTTLILDPTFNKFHFAELNGVVGEVYGRGGIGSSDDFDLTADFASKGPHLWLNTQTNVWSTVWPNVDGVCYYDMAATVRDFSKEHPDFDFGNITGDHSILGMVQNQISPARKPVRTTKAPASVSFTHFNDWWTTDTSASTAANLRRSESCYDIPMSKSSDGMWEYDSYRDGVNRGFWPVNGTLNYHKETGPSCYVKPPPDSTSWVTNGPAVNGNFCMESHASFIYQPGQKFDFRGDDDVWVFINDKLVVDLGGVHTPKSASVNLDNLGLTAGSEYKWDLFYCDRQPCGSSLRIKTSIYFKQQRALDTLITISGNTTTVEVFKREGGLGSCASAGSETRIVPPSNLVFQLVDAAGAVIETLAPGTHYTGINITAPKVIVNAETITGLAPGRYTILSFEAANEKLKVSIPFVVPSRNFVELEPKTVDTLVSAMVPVIAVNRAMGNVVAVAEKYNLVIGGPAGIKVYTSSTGGTALATGAALTTELTGYDTLWVTGDPAATGPQTITLNTQGSTKTVRITFNLPPPIVVELQPPFDVNVPVTTVVAVPAITLRNGVAFDTAVAYTLTLSPGAKVFSDATLATPVPANGGLTTLPNGRDTVWVAGDPAAFANQTVTLGTVGSTKQVRITFELPPVVLPKVLQAGVYDDDGNGMGDRIMAVYDSNLTLKTPSAVAYTWPTGSAAVNTPGASVGALLDPTGTILTFSSLTLSTTPQTSGTGTITTTFFVRGKDTSVTAEIVDRMAPMLTKAEAKQGTSGDTLLLTFSEPVNIAAITAAYPNLFQFQLTADTTSELLTPTGLGFTDGNRVAMLTYGPGVRSPQPGNRVRIAPVTGGIADGAGNTVGEQSRYRVIGGVKRTGLSSATFMVGEKSRELSVQPAVTLIRTEVGKEAKAIAMETGRLGHLIQVDLGDYAVKDDFTEILPKDVFMKWEVAYFDNLGNFVNKAQGTLRCDDANFYGAGRDCTSPSSRGHLFLGWNLYTLQGAQAATGAYIARIKYQAFAGPTVVAQNTRDERWGYLRKY